MKYFHSFVLACSRDVVVDLRRTTHIDYITDACKSPESSSKLSLEHWNWIATSNACCANLNIPIQTRSVWAMNVELILNLIRIRLLDTRIQYPGQIDSKVIVQHSQQHNTWIFDQIPSVNGLSSRLLESRRIHVTELIQCNITSFYLVFICSRNRLVS